MVVMKNITVQKHEVLEEKKNAFELTEKEASAAKNNVEAIETEIEAIKVKGQFEETFSRFPHVAEQIFETLDVQSLSKCQEASKCWQKFIFETNPLIRPLEFYTGIPKSLLKKSLEDYDFQDIQEMANCASVSYQKAVNATIPFEKPLELAEPNGSKLLYYILSEGKLNNTQFLLAKLMLLNKMDKSNLIIENDEIDYITALASLLIGKAKFGKGYTTFRQSIIKKEGKWGTIFSWMPIFHLAVTQNHLDISELIFDQIQDIALIPLIIKWGEIVLQFVIFCDHRNMGEFIINKIPGIPRYLVDILEKL